ncbi:MAG: hypothetical protein SCH98_03130 [Deferrisomatales bacterium]|nr:hypothetical protein [Deferrisomatales bacterium]
MSHRKRHPPPPPPAAAPLPGASAATVLELVLKADTAGTLEAAAAALAGAAPQGVELRVIQAGVGEVTQSDVLMAATGSKLVLGFQVPAGPRVEEHAREQGVEVRLYEVIYHLSEDARRIARSLVPSPPGERVTARAKVIALFKGSRRGMILGCEVLEGTLALGKRYRVIGPAGPMHEGKIASLHIGPDAVREAKPGQQVGLKVEGFQKARIGYWVECFEPLPPEGPPPWTPRGGVRRTEA